MKNRLGISAVVIALAVLASAGPALAHGVRYLGNRPGCDIQDGMIEVFNSDPAHYYKVHVVGTIANAGAGPSACSDATPCAGSFSGGLDLVMAPCHVSNFCRSFTALLATCDGCSTSCTATSCDNRRGIAGNPSCANSSCCTTCPATCDTANEWCTHLVDLQVTLVASSTNGRDWTTITPPQVIANKGSYGSDQAPTEESYCTNHSALRAACYFPDPNLLSCQYE